MTTGHGEWSLDESDERSLQSLKLGSRHDNIEWEPFDTLGKKAVPKGCDAVYVLGPTRAFSRARGQADPRLRAARAATRCSRSIR